MTKRGKENIELLLPFDEDVSGTAAKFEGGGHGTDGKDSSCDTDEAKDKERKKHFCGRPMKRKKKEQPKGSPSYLSLLNPAKAEELGKEIFKIVVLEKGFLNHDIKASDLAKRLGTNTRYFSITMSRRFHCNFSSFIGRLRVEEAMTYMSDSRFDEVSLQDLASLVGFSSRQSFISAFQKITGMTPSEYRASVRVG